MLHYVPQDITAQPTPKDRYLAQLGPCEKPQERLPNQTAILVQQVNFVNLQNPPQQEPATAKMVSFAVVILPRPIKIFALPVVFVNALMVVPKPPTAQQVTLVPIPG